MEEKTASASASPASRAAGRSRLKFVGIALLAALPLALFWSTNRKLEKQYLQPKTLVPKSGNTVDTAAFSPDGKLIATGAAGNVEVWEVRAGRRLFELKAPASRDSVMALAFGPDSETLAVAYYSAEVRVCDAATGQKRRSFRMGRQNPARRGCAFSPGGRFLVESRARSERFRDAAGGVLNIYDVAAGRLQQRLPSPVYAWSKAGPHLEIEGPSFSRDGKRVACFDETVILLGDIAQPASNGKRGALRLFAGTQESIHFEQLAFLDGQTLAEASQVYVYANGSLRSSIKRVNGESVVIGRWEGRVALWDVPTKRLRRVLRQGMPALTSLACSPDGKTLAVGGRRGEVQLWDTRTGRLRRALTRLSGTAQVFEFSPDGRLLAFAGPDGALRLSSVEK